MKINKSAIYILLIGLLQMILFAGIFLQFSPLNYEQISLLSIITALLNILALKLSRPGSI